MICCAVLWVVWCEWLLAVLDDFLLTWDFLVVWISWCLCVCYLVPLRLLVSTFVDFGCFIILVVFGCFGLVVCVLSVVLFVWWLLVCGFGLFVLVVFLGSRAGCFAGVVVLVVWFAFLSFTLVLFGVVYGGFLFG